MTATNKSFTDGEPRIATAEDLTRPWNGRRDGSYFRCYLCGHCFVVGDYWRWQYCDGLANFMVCESCDGEYVVERWKAMNQEARERFWWFNAETWI